MIAKQAIDILIVEDDQAEASLLKQSVENIGYEKPMVVTTVEMAHKIIIDHTPAIILCNLFLDNSPKGLDLLRDFSDQSSRFIMVTNCTEKTYYEQTKRIGVGGHIIKPFHYLTLQSIIDQLLAIPTATASPLTNYLFIRVAKNRKVRIDFADILYLYSERNYMFIKTADKLYTIKRSLVSMQEDLDERFVRIHNSYIINIDHLQSIASSTALIHKYILPLGRAYRKNLTGRIKAKSQKEVAA
ncbi:LytR/AlgR family response regulator transcription factor [Spirosoma aerophilum]